MNKLLLFIASFTLCLICSVQARTSVSRSQQLFSEVKNTKLVQSNPQLVEKVREKVRVNGCNVNLCFALDGSGSLQDNFDIQKAFVKLVAAIVGADDEAGFAGTVYGLVNRNISPLTTNAEQFILDVCDANFPSAPVTFISAGLGFCVNQLDGSGVAGDANKIVLLGDGFANFGDLTGSLSPPAIAQQWRDLSENNALCAIAVGFASTRALADITGDRNLVLEVTEWPKLLNILDELVEQVCFAEPKASLPAPPPHSKPILKCPCKCFIVKRNGKRKFRKSKAKARRQCRKFKQCRVSACSRKAFHCCN